MFICFPYIRVMHLNTCTCSFRWYRPPCHRCNSCILVYWFIYFNPSMCVRACVPLCVCVCVGGGDFKSEYDGAVIPHFTLSIAMSCDQAVFVVIQFGMYIINHSAISVHKVKYAWLYYSGNVNTPVIAAGICIMYQFYFSLTLCSLVKPYDDIDLRHHWLRLWLLPGSTNALPAMLVYH